MSFIVSLMLQFLSGSFSLRISRFNIPGAVMRGQPIWLNCSFDLESDKLYSVKWYKDNSEIYRYRPGDVPSFHKYKKPGVYIDLLRCYQGHVFFYRTDFNTEGTYKCEVSAESPSFKTVQLENDIQIYAVPDEGPIIRTVKTRNRNGEDVRIICTSFPSKPVSSLYWYINNQIIPFQYVAEYIMHESGQLISTMLEMKLRTVEQNYTSETLKIQCVANYTLIRTIASDEYYIANGSLLLPVISGRLHQGPVIKGERKRYVPGDLLQINCSAPKSMDHFCLKWFINQKEIREENLIKFMKIGANNKHEDIIGLKIIIEPYHFQSGIMRLKCSAVSTSTVLRTSKIRLFNDEDRKLGFFVAGGRNRALISKKNLQMGPSTMDSWLIAGAMLFSIIQK